MPDLVALAFDKPDLAIWTARNGSWAASGRWQGKLTDCTCTCDAPDLTVLGLVVGIFRKPEVAIWTSCDVEGIIARGERECPDGTGWSDSPKGASWIIVANKTDTPDLAVRPGRDTVGVILRVWEGEFTDRACGGDAPYLAVVIRGPSIGKPQGTILSRGDVYRLKARWQGELTDRTRRGNTPNLAALTVG